MPKHYRPAGKKKEGNAAKYMTRTKAVHFLQISLPTFRKLCVLKGITPRVPKKKVEGNHKTYYLTKDIMFLLHEPLSDVFRDIRAHKNKIKKAQGKKNKDLAERLRNRLPTYTLDRLILERYPSFVDALRDLDDCLTLVHLFAALPATEGERIEVDRIHKCRRLSHEWQAYISRTHSLRKAFISVKGIYYQAVVDGQKITWLTPHALQQVLTDDVDFNVMLTFSDFYEALLGFINFKLYHSINVKYPPILDPRLEALAAELYALYRCINARSRTSTGVPPTTSGTEQTQIEEKDKQADESEIRLAQLQHQLPGNEPGSLMHLMEDTNEVDDEDEETKECKSLFKNLKFFLSREVPRECLLFVIPAFGGVVSWEGDGSPFKESDEGITHQIVDRPTQGHVFLSREYIQPQWIFDCVNARIILPTEAYMVGRVPPPHLSPFVDNDAEGHVPEYAETIKRLQAAARNQVSPMPGLDGQHFDDAQALLMEGVVDRTEAKEAAEKKQQLLKFEKQYHEELDLEVHGITKSPLPNKKLKSADDAGLEGGDNIDVEQAAKDNLKMSQDTMPRKKQKLHEAMQIGIKKKKDQTALLKERKRKADAKKKA